MKIINFIKEKYLILTLLSFFTVLYILTLYPGVGGRVNYGDSAKWQFLWAVDGTPHSTGYPLFLIVSKLFGNTLLFLKPATRITMISVCSAIGTLYFLYKISSEYITHHFSRVLPSLILGTTFVFWSQATEAEVYTLNSFFVSVVIYLFILFHKTNNIKYYLLGIATYSISFGNHLTMITLLPAIIYICSVSDYKLILAKKSLFYTVILFAIGASQYLYLLYLSYHGSVYLEYIGRNASIGQWLSYITGGQFRNKIGGNNTFESICQAMLSFIKQCVTEIGWAIIIVILFFIFCQKIIKKNDDKLTAFIALIGIGELLYVLSYPIGDIKVYYIPVYLVLVLLIMKIVDYLESDSYKTIFFLSIIILSMFITIDRFKYLKITSNPIYSEVTNYFQLLPNNSLLFIPQVGIFHYAGFESVKYAQYIDFKNKNIKHITKLNGHTKNTFYVPSKYLSKIPLNLYTATPLGKKISLIELLKNNLNNLIIISGKDEAQHGLTEKDKKQLLNIGLHFSKLKYRGSYIAIINKGKVIKEIINNEGEIILQDNEIKKLGIDRIVSAGLKFGNKSQIIYKGTEVSQNKRGLNIAIINQHDDIHSYNIDTYRTSTLEPLLYEIKFKK